MQRSAFIAVLSAALAIWGQTPAIAQQMINIGARPNDGTGDSARDAYAKINANTLSLVSGLAAKASLASPTFTGVLTTPQLAITGYGSSGDVSGMTVAINSGGATGTLAKLLSGFAPLSSPSFTGTLTTPVLTITGSGSSGDVSGMRVTPNAGAASGTLANALGSLGTLATQNAGAVAITGGTINNTTIGSTTPSSGSFSTLSATTPLGLTSGGSGASTAAAARGNFGAAASGANTDITSLGAVVLGNGTTATTQAVNDNSTKAATTAYVATAITAGDQSATTTFTPTLTAASGTITTASASGRYRRLGSKLVWVSYNATITTNGTAAGNLIFSLPFTASAQNNVISGRENAATGKMLQGVTQPNTANLFVFNYDNTYPAANGYQIVVSGVYETQ